MEKYVIYFSIKHFTSTKFIFSFEKTIVMSTEHSTTVQMTHQAKTGHKLSDVQKIIENNVNVLVNVNVACKPEKLNSEPAAKFQQSK